MLSWLTEIAGVDAEAALAAVRERAPHWGALMRELGGVSRRTVRYYIQRGLLAAPTGVGRGRHYTQGHLDTLIRIRELQESITELTRALAIKRAESPDKKDAD